MLTSFIIVFREILEAALIVGVLFAATRGIRGRGLWILGGVLAGCVGAGLVALFTEAISQAVEGMGQEIFNASVLALAAALITWHVVWMKKSVPKLNRELKAAGSSVLEGRSSAWTLAVIAGLAVLREGAEIVLFVYGLLASDQEGISRIVSGSGLGLFAGALVGFIIYLGLIRVPTKHVFAVTGAVLTFLAAGMMANAAMYLTSAGILPGLLEPVWDSSRLLAEKDLLGSLLHSLAGYVERPSLLQVIVYLSTIGGIMLLQKFFGKETRTQVHKAVLAAFVLSAGLCGLARPAEAAPKVYSPYVDAGELEIEYEGSVTFDGRDDKDREEGHKVGVGYGVMERWAIEVSGGWADPAGSEDDGMSYEATEIENRIQLTEQGEYFADFGFMMENEFAAESEDRDELKLVLLVEKDWDLWRHRANPFVEFKYGGKAGDGEEPEDEWEAGLSWSTTYRASEAFEPGLEVHWAYENVDERLPFDEQEFQIGPVAYGKIGPSVSYELGYLFGVSEDSPDGELKWVFEYETRF